MAEDDDLVGGSGVQEPRRDGEGGKAAGGVCLGGLVEDVVLSMELMDKCQDVGAAVWKL
ncbi:hypothetical protein [Streptomyces specialis]|uniref:hypothetical protein n=1 Tax=Streptomyces specialis TaxID=498367 RepID=UPI00131EB062|nr:hypothetical protein [Streptomyces specialis]